MWWLVRKGKNPRLCMATFHSVKYLELVHDIMHYVVQIIIMEFLIFPKLPYAFS